MERSVVSDIGPAILHGFSEEGRLPRSLVSFFLMFEFLNG